MKGIVIGKINEFKAGDETKYKANFYDSFLRQTFDSKHDMLDFISLEAKSLFDLKENKIAAIKYRNLDGISHYFVIKDTGQEVVVGEQSNFEFKEAQSQLFNKYANKREINDRHYDFMDIVRGGANFNILSMWAKLLLIFFTAVAAIVVSVDILDMFGDHAKKATHLHELSYVSLSITNALLSTITLIISFISTYYAVIVYIEENNETRFFDFRKATRRRQFYRKLNLSFEIIALGTLSGLIYLSNNDGFFNEWTSLNILLIINMSIGFITMIFQIFYISIVYINFHKLFNIYFSKSNFSKFWKWYKSGKTNGETGSRDIFLLSNEESLALYTMELDSIKSVKKKDNRYEMKIYVRKMQMQLKNAVAKRKEQLAKGEITGDNIPENY